MICAFFGHRNVYEDIDDKVELVLRDLIENKKVRDFYVGHQGNFDTIVKYELLKLKKVYTDIKIHIVLAYVLNEKSRIDAVEECELIYPEILDGVPYRFAIAKRNKWMVEQANYVVTYVRCCAGGAAQFKEYAQRKKKNIIEI